MSVLNRIKNINGTDISHSLDSKIFQTTCLSSYGFRGIITSFAFDPVQGIFFAGTSNGYVHVFGQKNVEHVFSLKQNLEIRFLAVIKSVYLVAVDSSNTISVFSLDTKNFLSMQSIPGRITCIASDPAMDWLFIGLTSGVINVYDVDRGVNSPYYIGNVQKSFLPRSRLSPVLSMQIHPRDPSRILLCYKECAIVFNLISQEITLSLKYDLCGGAPGGDTNPLIIQEYRSPEFLQALWNPHGHHILTVHSEGSLVFWDANEGVLLQARTLTDTDVNLPRRNIKGIDFNSLVCKPISKVFWVCGQNPEETAIVVAGGDSFEGSSQDVTVLDFGVTPIVSVTSYPNMGQHYANPKRQRVFPTPEYASIIDFIPLPRSNPFYGGGCDPHAIIFRLANGELSILSYPDGFPVAPNSQLPSAFLWVQPFITAFTAASVPNNQLVGILASAPSVKGFFTGGLPTRRKLRSFKTRNALCTGHNDGSVRVWDASYGELDDSKIIEISLTEALKRHYNCAVEKLSFAPYKVELAVGTQAGETVLYKFGSGKKLANIIDKVGRLEVDQSQPIVNVQSRTTLRTDGFLPQFIINTKNGSISALLNTEVGFIVIGHKNGNLTVVDMRGPTFIFSTTLDQLTLKAKFGHKSYVTGQQDEYPTALDVSIYMLNGERFSSVVLSVGTSIGQLHTFRIMPIAAGGYFVDYVGVAEVGNSPIKEIVSFNTTSGQSCIARQEVMDMLSQGIKIDGALAVISKTDIKVFKSPKERLASRNSVTSIATGGLSILKENKGSCLVTVNDGCETIVYSLPALTEISKNLLPVAAAREYISDSLVLTNGDLFIRRNKLSGSLVSIWGHGTSCAEQDQCVLFDTMIIPPTRPIISTLQWIKGTAVATIQDVDLIVGGNHRPKSKAMIAQEKLAREQQLTAQQETQQRQNHSKSNRSSYFNGPIKSISNLLDNMEDSANDFMANLSKPSDNGISSDSGVLRSAFKAKFFS